MNEKRIVNAIIYGFYDLANKYYNDYVSNKNDKILNKYKKVLSVYSKLREVKSIDECTKIIEEVQNELNDIKDKYNEIYKKYNELPANKENKKKIDEYYNELVRMVEESSILFEMIEMFNKTKTISSKFSESKKEEQTKVETIKPKKEEQTKVETIKPKKEDNKTEKKININYDDPEIVTILDLNKKILLLKSKLESMDNFSNDAINVRKEITTLCIQREDIAKNYMGYDGINLVKYIESLETSYVVAPDLKKASPYKLNSNEYSNKLKKIITTLADLRFNGMKSSYFTYNTSLNKNENISMFKVTYDKAYREYYNMIFSLFNEGKVNISSSDEHLDGISTNKLLSYCSLFNLNGGYEAFKRKHSSGKIGNDAIDKNMYDSGVKDINDLINCLCNQSKSKIDEMGGSITISDHSKYKSDIAKEIDSKFGELYKNIMQHRLNGEMNVHR